MRLERLGALRIMDDNSFQSAFIFSSPLLSSPLSFFEGAIRMVHRDVIVIGAGWSGLLACKCMLEEGLTVATLEKRVSVGGIWKYSEDPHVVTVMQNTKCTSSSSVTEMSDFPMPDEIGQFPKQDDVFRYLISYCDNFKLWPHIHLGHGVKNVEKKEDMWEVECEQGQVSKKDALTHTRTHTRRTHARTHAQRCKQANKLTL